MTTKILIKAGTAEFSYEGQAEFPFDKIEKIFSHIEKLSNVAPSLAQKADSPAAGGAGASKPTKLDLHVNSIAAKLGAKTGGEVARAAAACLQIAEGKETFTRAELLTTMKKATKFYKDNMSSNLTKIIETLLNGKLNQIGTDTYSLTAAEYTALESALA